MFFLSTYVICGALSFFILGPKLFNFEQINSDEQAWYLLTMFFIAWPLFLFYYLVQHYSKR